MDRGDKIAVLVLVVLAWVAGAVLGLAFTGPQKIGTTTIEIGPDCRLVVVERRVRECHEQLRAHPIFAARGSRWH